MVNLQDCYGAASKTLLDRVRATFEESPAPPFFRLESPLAAIESKLPFRAGVVYSRRSDSGVLEMRVPSVRLRALGDSYPDLATTILEAVESVDKRVLVDSITAGLERGGRLRTSIPDFATPIRVFGPGGGILISDTRDGVEISVVVRRRIGTIPSMWRRPEAVVADVFERFGIPGEDVSATDLELRFGYFELSKYDQQLTMRPAVIVQLDLKPDETGVPYRMVSVAAATTAPDIGADEGLGSWA
jgi:hypothetical protein